MGERATAPTVEAELPPLADDAARVAHLALAEDGDRDVSTESVGAGTALADGVVEARERCVFAGLPYGEALVRRAGAEIVWAVPEGSVVQPSATLGTMRGTLDAVLRAERALLNLLQRASGIATRTRAFVDAVAGTRCRILHTRKTAPGLRAFDVRAVLAGGGAMNRGGLARTVMIKDNHWRALAALGGDMRQVIQATRDQGLFCVVEVESAEQVQLAAGAGADRLLIDNQSPAVVVDWTARARGLAPSVEIEASGGLTLENVRAYADAGADFVSVGALTHSVTAADLAFEITQVKP